MKFWLLIFFLFPQISLAAAVVMNVTGASVFVNITTNLETNIIVPPEIFGGLGGPNCSSQVSNTETCNSCAENTLAVCNPKRVYPSLKLRIEFIDQARAGRTLVTKATQLNEIIPMVDSDSSGNRIVPAGGTHIAVITWGTLCDRLNNGNSDCTNSFNQRIRVGVSDNGTDFVGTTQDINIRLINPSEAIDTVANCDTATRGICNFFAYPGDRKVFLEDILHNYDNFPSDSNVRFKFFRIIYSTESFNKNVLNPRRALDTGNYADISILDSDGGRVPDLGDNSVSGLANDNLYYFRGMVVDEADNIMDITADSAYLDHPDCPNNLTDPPESLEKEFLCPLTARPGAVVGLLTEDLNCFISTVAFGSSFHPMVQDFRKFRNRFLLHNSAGQKLIRAYYKYGSQISQVIAKNELAKGFARLTLYPIWAFAKLSLKMGLASGFFVLAILISLGFFTGFYLKKKSEKAHLHKILSLFFVIASLIPPSAFGQDIQEPVQRNTLPSSKYDNTTNREIKVRHPLAEKGLTRITSDKEYLYETVESPMKHSMGIKFGIFDPINLKNGQGTNFASIYNRSNSPMILIDYEWKWKPFLGEVNWQVGTGLYFTQGNGVFKNNPGIPAREKFTFLAIPITANFIFKLKLSERQWIVPFGGAGLGIMGFSEIRDDFAGPKFGATAIAPVFVGGALSVNALAPETGRTLDREYGINRTLIAVELRQFLAVTNKFDFSGDIINAGLMIEY